MDNDMGEDSLLNNKTERVMQQKTENRKQKIGKGTEARRHGGSVGALSSAWGSYYLWICSITPHLKHFAQFNSDR